MDNAVMQYSPADIAQMADTVAKSGIFPAIKTKEQAAALMLLCQAEGIHPMQALKKYHLVQNRPAMKAEAMLATFQSRGGKVKYLEMTDALCEAEFYAPGVDGCVTIEWDLEKAKNAGLLGKDNWNKYPRAMLRSRVVSEGVRAADPGAVLGVYTPEETEDFEPARPQIVQEEQDKAGGRCEPPPALPPVVEEAPPATPTFSPEEHKLYKIAKDMDGEVVTELDIPPVPYMTEKPPWDREGEHRIMVFNKAPGKNLVWNIEYPNGKTLKDLLKDAYWMKWGKDMKDDPPKWNYGFCWWRDQMNLSQCQQAAAWILSLPCPFNPGVTLKDSKMAKIEVVGVESGALLYEYPPLEQHQHAAQPPVSPDVSGDEPF